MALLTILAGALLMPTSAPAAVVLGVYTRTLYDNSALAIAQLRSELGAAPQIAMYYEDWNQEGPTPLVNREIIGPLIRRGIVPMVTWQPCSATESPLGQRAYSPLRVAEGAFDSYLWDSARQAARLRHRLFVRLAPEMNGDWDAWGVKPGNSPRDYVAMWRHVVSIFRAAGASNVRWVWSPNVYASGSAKPFNVYYPGDAWVDDVALDGYNWGPAAGAPWETFDEVFQASYDALTRLTSKPLMITETASTELGGSKSDWIRAIPHTLKTEMPRVRALVWFDVNKETDWRLDSSPSSLLAFRRLVASGVFSAPLAGLLQ